MDEDNNLIDVTNKQMTLAEYIAYGSTKKKKDVAILNEIRIIVLPPPTPMM
jgi:hypothetical protein